MVAGLLKGESLGSLVRTLHEGFSEFHCCFPSAAILERGQGSSSGLVRMVAVGRAVAEYFL